MGALRGRRVNTKGRNEYEQYTKLSYRMLRSDAFRSLSGGALKVYLELRYRFNGGNNGRLTLAMDEAARLLGIGKATAVRAFAELIEKGFITLVKRGQWYGRMASEYAVTDKPIDGQQPTNEWKNWRPTKTESRYSGGPYQPPDGSVSEPKT